MSYQEKKSIVFLISTLLIFGFFSLYIYNRYHDILILNPNDFRFWGKTFLKLVLVSIVTNIIIAIIFAIINKIATNEDMPSITDERDKIVELKATRISNWVFIFGFILSMASQAIGMQPWVLFVTLISSGWIAACVSEFAKFYMYRKGI